MKTMRVHSAWKFRCGLIRWKSLCLREMSCEKLEALVPC